MRHGSREEELVLLNIGKSNTRERQIENTWMEMTRFISVLQFLRVKVAPISIFIQSWNLKPDHTQVDCLTMSGDLFS